MIAIVSAVTCGILAVLCLCISLRQFRGKGFLFNNAYIWASKRERNEMDKTPYYRQSGVVFLLCAAMFVCMALECVLLTDWLWLAVAALCGAALIYAIVSSVRDAK